MLLYFLKQHVCIMRKTRFKAQVSLAINSKLKTSATIDGGVINLSNHNTKTQPDETVYFKSTSYR